MEIIRRSAIRLRRCHASVAKSWSGTPEKLQHPSEFRKASMKALGPQFALLLFLVGSNADGSVPDNYKGKPFQDATHTAGPQTISGRLEAALYDLGGEGIANHDVDQINHGSGELNHKPEHCEEGVAGVGWRVCRKARGDASS